MVDGWTRWAIMHEGEDNEPYEFPSQDNSNYSDKKPEPKPAPRKSVDQLISDLDAEIVVQEGKSHTETVRVKRDRFTYADVDPESAYQEQEIIDQNRIAYPDTEKRNSARAELKAIYDNSKWYQILTRWKIKGVLEK